MDQVNKPKRGRPAKVMKSVEKTMSLPQELVLKVDLLLFSELESKVPHGAWSRFVTGLITNFLKDEYDLQA